MLQHKVCKGRVQCCYNVKQKVRWFYQSIVACTMWQVYCVKLSTESQRHQKVFNKLPVQRNQWIWEWKQTPPCALNVLYVKMFIWLPDCYFVDEAQATLCHIFTLQPFWLDRLARSPSRVFLRPSAPTTTWNSKLATGWSAGRTAALHPSPERWRQRREGWSHIIQGLFPLWLQFNNQRVKFRRRKEYYFCLRTLQKCLSQGRCLERNIIAHVTFCCYAASKISKGSVLKKECLRNANWIWPVTLTNKQKETSAGTVWQVVV